MRFDKNGRRMPPRCEPLAPGWGERNNGVVEVYDDFAEVIADEVLFLAVERGRERARVACARCYALRA